MSVGRTALVPQIHSSPPPLLQFVLLRPRRCPHSQKKKRARAVPPAVRPSRARSLSLPCLPRAHLPWVYFHLPLPTIHPSTRRPSDPMVSLSLGVNVCICSREPLGNVNRLKGSNGAPSHEGIVGNQWISAVFVIKGVYYYVMLGNCKLLWAVGMWGC